MATEINPAALAMTDAEAEAAARQIIADFATSYRDPAPLPAVGTALPVPQPGRPPMSQGATDASALMLAGGATAVMVGGSGAALMYFSQYADPVVCALVFGSPTVLVLALARLMRRAKHVLPAEIHHHYTGPVHQEQRNVHNHNRLLGKSTTNL